MKNNNILDHINYGITRIVETTSETDEGFEVGTTKQPAQIINNTTIKATDPWSNIRRVSFDEYNDWLPTLEQHSEFLNDVDVNIISVHPNYIMFENEYNMVCIDLDNCLDDNGNIKNPKTKQLVGSVDPNFIEWVRLER